MRRLFLLAFCLTAVPLFAESDTGDVHFAAHFGLSFSIETVLYGVSRKALRMNNVDALVFSMAIALAGTTVRQVIASDAGHINTIGISQNALGIGASMATSLVFAF